MSFEDILELGRKHEGVLEAEYWRRGESIKMSDAAICIYTSGTTGPPRSDFDSWEHHGDLGSFRQTGIFLPEEDRTVAWLPLPHVFGRFVILSGIYNASVWSYAGGTETLIDDLSEIKPTVFHSVPRMYEKIHHKLVSSMEQASPLKRRS